MNISYDDFYIWVADRETLQPQSSEFWAWKEAYVKGIALVDGLQDYFHPQVYRILAYNLCLHYCISTDFTFNGVQNPLYVKYKMAEAGKGIVAHASDVSSSATLHIPDAMQKLDYLGMDLISTPYGKYAYGILSTVNIVPVRL